ncbi:MAG: 4Fe-4S dicluster domain-containing protein, partial [Planctomycetes bacterium]|nr:4Fe-4S dicluster domain-containing protein [Planctomycetota bacterium]
MITVDSAKCTGCGSCVDVCPDYVFHSKPDSTDMEVRHPDYCCACGHCVAICPVNAIEHQALPARGFQTLTTDPGITPEQMKTLLLSRRSIRAYREKTVSREQLEQLIEAGVCAGTASNAQTEGFIIIQDRPTLVELEQKVITALWQGGLKFLGSALGHRLASMVYGRDMTQQLRVYHDMIKTLKETDQLDGMVFRSAPAVIVIHGVKANDQVHANCAIAARNMEIMAESMGLGTCWVGFLTAAAHMSKTIGAYLSLPKNRNIYGALMVGHPKHTYKKRIPRTSREVRWM